MLPHTERIDGFARKVTRTEKAFYERFRHTEEAAVVAQMRDHFAQAKQTGGALRLDHPVLHARLEAAVTDWIVQACADQHLNREWIARAEEAILHRVRMLLAQTLRDALGTR
jgi:hypothetical protein